MELTEILERAIRLYHDNTAVLCGDTVYTYRECYERVNRLGSALQALGVQKGDRVAYLGLNCHRQFEWYLAVPRIGAVVVPLNVRLAPQEIAYIINHAEAKVLLTDDALLPMAQAIQPKLETVKHFVYTGQDGKGQNMLSYETLLDEAGPTPAPMTIESDDLAGIFYTGGTTGKPKGVMLTHDNLMACCLQILPSMNFTKTDVFLNAAPMFHLANRGIMYTTAMVGATQAFVKSFAPDVVIQGVERYKVTVVVLVPTMVNLMLNHPDLVKYDLSSLRFIGYGGSPMPAEVARRGMEKLSCGFLQAFGMTEASVLTILSQQDHVLEGRPEALARLASAGQPICGVRLRVVNENGEDVKPGEVGEVIAKGPNVMKGYWRMPEETAEVLKDGWYHTGDLAKVDNEFYVYIVDRAKDMIVTGGENVYSSEVEAVLYAHPAVLEAAVIGVPDEKWGEAVKALVVLRPGHSSSGEELIAHCKQSIASYKAPKSVDFVESFPKSGAGKILKREVREPYWRGYDRRVH